MELIERDRHPQRTGMEYLGVALIRGLRWER